MFKVAKISAGSVLCYETTLSLDINMLYLSAATVKITIWYKSPSCRMLWTKGLVDIKLI